MKYAYLLSTLLVMALLTNCTSLEKEDSTETQPVFDIAMQGVNPGWFERAMEGVDYGIHRLEKYGEMASDSADLFNKTFEQMDEYNIPYAMLSHGTYKESLLRRQPERFLLSFEPDLSLEDHTEAAKEFEQKVIDGTYSALGELGLVYEGIPVNTKSLYPYYEVAQKHGIPILIHTGFSGPNPQQVLSSVFDIASANPILLESVVADFPDLNIIMMHMSWPFFDEGLYMLSTYPNVYMETSVAVWLLGDPLFNRLLEEAVVTAGSDKILFGTLQMAWPGVIGRSVETIRNADYLSEEDKKAIFWGNAKKLLQDFPENR